jgi:hypothetical protein
MDAESFALFREEVDIGFTISVGEEDVHPSHTALSDVVWRARDYDARDARHAISLPYMSS